MNVKGGIGYVHIPVSRFSGNEIQRKIHKKAPIIWGLHLFVIPVNKHNLSFPHALSGNP